MQNPVVTVVIPVYNGERFIKQAIESVLNQTYPNFILKIFDNYSTDNTQEIVNSFDDHRIKYIRNGKNIGMLPNWKKALDSANTKYVAVLFADDFYKQNFLEKTVQAMENNQAIALVSGGHETYNEKNELMGIRKRKNIGIFSAKEYYKYIYTLREVPPPSETVLLNKVVQNVGGYDIKNLNWIVDADLYLKISRTGYGANHLEDILSCRRSWGGNSTVSIGTTYKALEDRYYLLNKYFDNKFIDETTRINSYKRTWIILLYSLYNNFVKMNFKCFFELIFFMIFFLIKKRK
ncbi:MAG: glycosyltransferase [Thermodesulfobacteriota bacterium]|nr:glycosyltransferase [Thermodesulfobacteriota bacterium]